MNVQVVFSPTLKIDSQTFVAAWNNTPQYQAQAQAEGAEDPSQSYNIDPELLRLGMVALATAVTTAAAQGFLDGIKDFVKEQTQALLKEMFSEDAPQVEVDTVPQADGSVLLVVREQE